MANKSWRQPSPVQELAGNAREPPSRYLLREQDRLGEQLSGAELPEPIPTIDLRRLSASDGGGEEAAKLKSALQSWGFFLVSNHGIEASLTDDVTAAYREFFLLPPEEKKRHSNLIDGKHFQLEGYGNDPVKTQDQILDWSDRLHLRVEPEDERNLAHWPLHPKRFRDVVHEYTVKNKMIRDTILRAIARLLELDEAILTNQFSSKASTTYARCNYYPPCRRPDLVFGLRPHADAIALTVLLMDQNVEGLQVLRDDRWYDIPALRDHNLLINIGVTLEIMTNGIFRAPVHRVVTNAEKERISLALFYSVDPEKVIEPMAELLDETQPARYRKIKAKDLLVSHFECFSRGARVVDQLKI